MIIVDGVFVLDGLFNALSRVRTLEIWMWWIWPMTSAYQHLAKALYTILLKDYTGASLVWFG